MCWTLLSAAGTGGDYTVTSSGTVMRDGFAIRRTAAERRIPCFTSLDTARAAIDILGEG